MQLVWAERSYRITTGFFLSVLFHIGFFVAIILVSLYHPLVEPVPPPGIEATIVSDITAAPKVDKAGKPMDKPKPPTPPAPEQKKPEPPKPAPPKTPAPSAPPPEAAPAKAVDIPDETKKAEEKKPEEKKPEEKKNEKKTEDKKKQQKQDENDFQALLNNIAKDQPAPDTQEKPKPKAKPAPAQPTTGPQAALLTDGPPMTASENDAIRTQLIPCWSFDPGVPNPENYTVVVRISVREDGVVTAAQVLDTSRLGDPTYRAVAETALRAVQNPSCVPLKLPQGKYWPQMDVVFDLAKAINGGY
jgi:TonB family protein